MIEAMSAGLACIVSDVGMIPDYIQNEYNGLIFENKKVKELYRALIKLVGNEEFTLKIAKNGFQYAKSNFSIENGIGILSEQVERITKNSESNFCINQLDMIFKDKILLITGGTGSFGNAVVEKLINSDLKEIRVLSRDEKKQDDMRKNLKALN